MILLLYLMAGAESLLTHEHIETAREFLEKADQEFAAGDVLQGSEKTWGAASHMVMAAAQQRGWPFGDHRSLKATVERLSEEQGDPSLSYQFAVAEKFHANFYHRFMQDYEFVADRPTVRRFVERMQELLTQS